MNLFLVQLPGLFTTVQDLGRHGYLAYGVPISGAMDPGSLVAANLLVGNKEHEACIETTLVGPELKALESLQIAVTGGACSPKINGNEVSMWKTLTLNPDDTISFGRMSSGCRAYISVRGGIDVPLVLGSKSTYVRGGFGGLDGRQFRVGDVIRGFDTVPMKYEKSVPECNVPQFNNRLKVDVILGPQERMFTQDSIETFLSAEYSVTLNADRMGYRLDGAPIHHRGKADIVSDALLPGAIQVPKDEKPILIMRDAQTTGGYPKIAVVTTPDLILLGQTKPKDTLVFSAVSLKEAHQRINEHYAAIDRLRSELA